MVTKDIQDLIARHYTVKKYSPCCTNFQGAGYQECDVVAISGSDFVYEFEVKISRGDFKKDKEKVYKHRYLKEAFEIKKQKKRRTRKVSKIPNYFTYVCPKGLIKLDEIPDYAGLIYVHDSGYVETIRKAPLLHRDKADMKLIKRIAQTLSERALYNGMSYITYCFKRDHGLLDDFERKW